MQRRDFLKQSTAALAAASIAPLTSVAEPAKGPVNLLFMTADDLNYTMPGFMGNKHGYTPNLDALAARSYRFVNNRSTNPICQPSREAMMTGLIPHHSGALGFNPVYPGVPTLATLLHGKGYYMSCIHKTEHHKPDASFPWDAKVVGTDRSPLVYEQGAREAMAAAAKANKPFFVYCNCSDPHHPFYGSAEESDMSHGDTGPYKVPHELTADEVEVPSVLENLPAVRAEWARYCNNVQRLDISMGKVLKVLEESGQADNTIIIFTVDHGMPFPFSKATVYDNGTRTPALLAYPGMGKARTLTERTCNIDLLPTLCDLMNVPKPTKLDGHSWMPLIAGTEKVDREYLVTHVNTVNSGKPFPMRAIQDDRYSLIFSSWPDGKRELKIEAMGNETYPAMMAAAKTDPRIAKRMNQFVMGLPLAFYDLKNDPDQRTNILQDASVAPKVDKMKGLLLAYMETTGDPELENYKLVLAGKQAVLNEPPPKHGGGGGKGKRGAGEGEPKPDGDGGTMN